jgi:hypothetical protein
MDRIAVVEHNFKHHPPSPQKVKLYEALRASALELALKIHEVCPESREQFVAITKTEEALMWANAAIARNPMKGDE